LLPFCTVCQESGYDRDQNSLSLPFLSFLHYVQSFSLIEPVSISRPSGRH
jgi:hypothetical protein